MNGKAVCLLRMDKWAEGLEVLQEAFEKDVKNPETLANLVSASLLVGKSSSRHLRWARCQMSDNLSQAVGPDSSIAISIACYQPKRVLLF